MLRAKLYSQQQNEQNVKAAEAELGPMEQNFEKRLEFALQRNSEKRLDFVLDPEEDNDVRLHSVNKNSDSISDAHPTLSRHKANKDSILSQNGENNDQELVNYPDFNESF